MTWYKKAQTEPNPLECMDCHADTSSKGLNEFYRVTDEVWSQARMHKGELCIGCLEKRLGRTLKKNDFEQIPLNYPEEYGFSVPKSQRLLMRLHA